MIGFLTVLGYSLYDTVVVFDKVRENTNEAFANGRLTFAQAANLAVNQTMVRSINTTVVGLLPIAAVLVVGFTFLGPGVLLDLALALFVGIADRRLLLDLHRHAAAGHACAGASRRSSSSRRRPPRYQARKAKDVAAAEAAARRRRAGRRAGRRRQRRPRGRRGRGRHARPVGPVHKYAQPTQAGPRNQPRRTPKSKR